VPAIGNLSRQAKDTPGKTTKNARGVSHVGKTLSGELDYHKAEDDEFIIEAGWKTPVLIK
jgi:hypothetical protein